MAPIAVQDQNLTTGDADRHAEQPTGTGHQPALKLHSRTSTLEITRLRHSAAPPKGALGSFVASDAQSSDALDEHL